MKNFSVKIGFVPSYRPYGPIPDLVVSMRKDAITHLEKIDGLDLVYPKINPDDPQINDPIAGFSADGCVCNLDEAEVVVDYFRSQKVDAIIIGAMNFGDERSAIKVAERLGVPVFLYATKEPPARQHPSLMRVSDSYCGTIAIAAGMYRRELNYHFGGIFFHEEPEFAQAVSTFVHAVAVKKSLTNARIAQIGVRPLTFESVAFDEIAMAKKFSQNVIYTELDSLTSQAQSLPDDDPRVVAAIKVIEDSVANISVARDWLVKAAKLEVVIDEFWQVNKLSAMSIQCWPGIQRSWGMSVCAILGNLTGKGMLTACETDTMGALAMLVSYGASLGQNDPHFVDWTIQHRDNPNWFLSWHCGNAPISLARNTNEVALRSRLDMVGDEPVVENDMMAGLYQFQVTPGEVTFCRLSEVSGQWKMLVAPGQIIPTDEVLTGTWAWVEVNDHQRLYRTIVENGFIHHASMAHGNQVDTLTLACKLMDIEPVIVD
jgi:L-fucose isomerase-like protein